MTDTPRDPEHEHRPTGHDRADEPVTGAPAGAADPGAADPGAADPAAPTASAGGAGDAAAAKRGRRWWAFGSMPGGADDAQRRRRRWFLIAIGVGAAVIVVALCAGALSVVRSVDDVRDRASDAREARHLRESDCLDLERRLNRLAPPGATAGPKERATAIRDENAAVRLYLDQLHGQREQDGWRRLIDARTVFADALDKQASSRTPAFYVAPRADDGVTVAEELEQWSPAPCAGPIHRLAAPEL